jgi:glycosyltransferase involved in cell wall biosynthesis
MPLKILFLSHVFAPAIGGIETSSLFLANAFAEAGHQVRLMTMTTGETTDALPYRVIRKPSISKMIQQHLWADIVFENNPCLRLGYPELFFRKPSIIVLHTWLNELNATSNFVDRIKLFWLSRAKKVITISKAVQQRCWPSAVVISNTYNDRLFGVRHQERRKDFVFVGRLVSDKGVELAIRAFSSLAFSNSGPELENTTLTIIGEGTEYDKLNELVNTLPDPSRVRFVGSLTGEALVDELNRHSFQFIPSIWEEPFGIVALEGIACGLIPIVSDGGGLPDAVGQAGVVFKRGQLDSLIAVTTALLQSDELQEQCLKAASDHLSAHSSKAIAKQYLAVLEPYTPTA